MKFNASIFVLLAGVWGCMPAAVGDGDFALSRSLRESYRKGELITSERLPRRIPGCMTLRPVAPEKTKAFLLEVLKREVLPDEVAARIAQRYARLKSDTLQVFLQHPALRDGKAKWLEHPPSRRSGFCSVEVMAWHLYVYDSESILAPDLASRFGVNVKEAADRLGLDYAKIRDTCEASGEGR